MAVKKNLTYRDDYFFGTGIAETVYALGGNDELFGGRGNDKLAGDDGNDRLFGDAGNDELFGGKGEDLLVGGSGNDRLVGGFGDDTYVGGTGRDIFTSVSLNSNIPGYDTIQDFRKGEDKIRVSTRVDWRNDLDTNGNGILDNNDAYVNVSGSGKTVVIDMADAAGFYDKLDVLTIKTNGTLTEGDFIYRRATGEEGHGAPLRRACGDRPHR
jgi:hypothetical protein